MMDAVEFLDKVDRLSKRGSTEEKMRYNDYRTAGDNVVAVNFVKRWAVAHPIKTRQSVFLEQYPTADADENGVLEVCPALLFASHRGKKGGCSTPNRSCDDCRKEFWLAKAEDV